MFREVAKTILHSEHNKRLLDIYELILRIKIIDYFKKNNLKLAYFYIKSFTYSRIH